MGITAGHYDANWIDRNLRAAVGPFCSQVRSKLRTTTEEHSAALSDRLSEFITITPHPAYLIRKKRLNRHVEFMLVEFNNKVEQLLDLKLSTASMQDAQNAYYRIVHRVYKKHWKFMQTFYQWDLIRNNRPALHHPTFLQIRPGEGRRPDDPYVGTIWSADIYCTNLGEAGFLCLVHLERATSSERTRLASGEMMAEHREPWIPSDNLFYESAEYKDLIKEL
jgi:hypothetical protein